MLSSLISREKLETDFNEAIGRTMVNKSHRVDALAEPDCKRVAAAPGHSARVHVDQGIEGWPQVPDEAVVDIASHDGTTTNGKRETEEDSQQFHLEKFLTKRACYLTSSRASVSYPAM